MLIPSHRPNSWAILRLTVLFLASLCLPACSSDGTAPASLPAEDAWKSKCNQMVKEQLLARGFKDPIVLDAVRSVPRHLFLPEQWQARAYDDTALPIGFGQTISQPYVVAYMTDLLKLNAGDKVLEIGTGSGYQAAVLAKIAREVYSIEIVDELAKIAGKRLSGLGYSNVHVRSGDGYKGWPEAAPFDAIIVTAAPEQVPQPLIDQLKAGGRLVVPVGKPWQTIRRLTRSAGGIETEKLIPVMFVPMTGEAEKQH